MTPTKLIVTKEEYNAGSSAYCLSCRYLNYFLVPLKDVSYCWECANCRDENNHPLVSFLKRKLDEHESP